MKALARMLAASVSIVLIGGCASLLGVDSGDYVDAVDLLCRCANQEDACRGVVEGAVTDNPDVEQIALDCLTEVGDDCGKLYVCVADSYCVDVNARCGGESKSGALVVCCDGRTCDAGRCKGQAGAACADAKECLSGLSCTAGACAAPECVADAANCSGGGTCCSGEACGADGACPPVRCGGPDAPCEKDSDCCSTSCRSVGGGVGKNCR